MTAACDGDRVAPTAPTAASPPLPAAPAPTPGARIRIANVGSFRIFFLDVVMPDEVVVFGDVASNTLTEYRETRFGAYSDTGYTFAIEDVLFGPNPPLGPVARPVPLAGYAFTYYLVLEVDPLQGPVIRTVRITRDE